MKHFTKRRLAQSISLAIVGTGTALSIGVAQAGNVVSSPFDEISNDQDPAFVQSRNDRSTGFKVPAGETKVTVSGYVKSDFIFDLENDLGDSFFSAAIPTTGSDGDGQFRAHATQSRLRVRTETEVGGQTLKAHVEGDFTGSGGNQSFSNSTVFRLRHAYFTVGGWTIGQVWTNFMDFVAYPSTVDFHGPAGKSFARQAQIRYTFNNGVSLSLENPETDGNIQTLDENGDPGAPIRIRESTGGPGRDQLPDLVAAWRGGPGGFGGKYETAVIVRSLGVGGEIDETTAGFGINLAGAWDFGFGKLAASITTGSGIGRYIISGPANGVFVTTDGDIEAVTATGVSLSYQQRWTPNSSSTIAYGGFQNDDDFPASGTDNVQSFHANYMWQPTDVTSYGVEVIVGNRETANGDTGTETRLQFGAQLNF